MHSEGEGYLFSHALVQESVYSSLLKRQRRALHQRAAGWFSEDLALRAQHLDYAEDNGAPRAYLEAAREQARQYRYETALSLIDRALKRQPQQGDRHALVCLKAEILLDLGDVVASMDAYEQAESHAEDEMQLFDAWMGKAACMRITTDYTGALELLDKCEPMAVKHGLTSQLSRLHHLRGNLFFPLGNVEGCHEAHQRALEFARRAGSAEEEARALGGLGDAEYARGRMKSAYETLRQCVEHCREHGFGRVEVANLSQMTNCQVFLGDFEHSLQSSWDAVQAAVRVSHRRAEMNALSGVCNATFELGDVEQLESAANRGMELARMLKAKNWESVWQNYQARTFFLRGERERGAEVLVGESWAPITFISISSPWRPAWKQEIGPLWIGTFRRWRNSLAPSLCR